METERRCLSWEVLEPKNCNKSTAAAPRRREFLAYEVALVSVRGGEVDISVMPVVPASVWPGPSPPDGGITNARSEPLTSVLSSTFHQELTQTLQSLSKQL